MITFVWERNGKSNDFFAYPSTEQSNHNLLAYPQSESWSPSNFEEGGYYFHTLFAASWYFMLLFIVNNIDRMPVGGHHCHTGRNERTFCIKLKLASNTKLDALVNKKFNAY